MEKEMLVLVDLKEGKFEKFMGWMQSDENECKKISNLSRKNSRR